MVGGVYTDDGYNLMTNWTPGHLEFGLYTADTTIKYEYYNQSQTIVTHDTVFIFPVWLILLTILAVVIYILRKKEVSSPLKIKIEWNK